jgi:hypothetical protein
LIEALIYKDTIKILKVKWEGEIGGRNWGGKIRGILSVIFGVGGDREYNGLKNKII